MSIISGNRNRAAINHVPVSASIHRALREPSKRDLQEMLAEAARNTAEQARRFLEPRELGKPPVDPDAEQLAGQVGELVGELERGVA